MGRNIVLCFDGTNNEYAETNTNVIKLYGMLDRTGGDQLAYYQPGIGTFALPGVWGRFRKWFITRLDLACGECCHGAFSHRPTFSGSQTVYAYLRRAKIRA